MDGNHSLLVLISTMMMHSAENQAPLLINIVLGLPANMCVMWLILAGPGDKAAEISSLNQAICEMGVIASSVLWLITIHAAKLSDAILTVLWYGNKMSFGLLFSGRPLFMGCVCLERYLAVVHPVKFLKYKRLRYRLAASVVSWLMVLLCSMTLLWVPYPDIYFVPFGMSSALFLVQLFFCVQTLCTLVRPGPGEGNQESKVTNGAKRKASRIILLILVSEAVTYLPCFITVITFACLPGEVSQKMYVVAQYMILVTGFIPPLLFIQRSGKLPNCFKDTHIGNTKHGG